MKNWQSVLLVTIMFSGTSFAWSNPDGTKTAKPCSDCQRPHGWSFDLGGQYTWMSFTTPPTFKGSTGGTQGKITYQESNAFFGQLRSIYNVGSLSSSQTKSCDYEWYSEFVSGYCFCAYPRLTITPYAGIGLDFLKDHKKAYSIFSSVTLNYRTYYALFGFDMHYAWENCYLGLQVDCLPVFDQCLSIGGVGRTSWKMQERVGVAGRLPVGCKLSPRVWLELEPYYRLLPIGASNTLDVSKRNLNQWGGFLTFRFFLDPTSGGSQGKSEQSWWKRMFGSRS